MHSGSHLCLTHVYTYLSSLLVSTRAPALSTLFLEFLHCFYTFSIVLMFPFMTTAYETETLHELATLGCHSPTCSAYAKHGSFDICVCVCALTFRWRCDSRLFHRKTVSDVL